MAGRYSDAAELAYEIFGSFQRAIDAALAEKARALYAGRWESEDKESSAEITIENGMLFIENLRLNGTKVLPLFGAAVKVALRPTERRDELRYALSHICIGSDEVTSVSSGWTSAYPRSMGSPIMGV